MGSLNYPETPKWVVAHNGTDVYHVSLVEPQNCFSSGQPYMDIFDSKEELLVAFPHLSGYFVVPSLPEPPSIPEIPLI